MFTIRYSTKEVPYSGSAINNGREPRSCLGQVFNFKLASFADTPKFCSMSMATSKVENLAQVSSC